VQDAASELKIVLLLAAAVPNNLDLYQATQTTPMCL
jgi:hypothetical protein